MSLKERSKLDSRYVKDLRDEIYRLNVSAETKVAFTKYLWAVDRKDIQRCRRIALYGFFYSERAFALSRQYEKEYSVWYQHMREVLLPDIRGFASTDQQCIIANLAMENTMMRENTQARRLFEDLMRNM